MLMQAKESHRPDVHPAGAHEGHIYEVTVAAEGQSRDHDSSLPVQPSVADTSRSPHEGL